MIFHENRLPADNSHEISCLICYFWKSSKIWNWNCHLLQIICGALRVNAIYNFSGHEWSDIWQAPQVYIYWQGGGYWGWYSRDVTNGGHFPGKLRKVQTSVYPCKSTFYPLPKAESISFSLVHPSVVTIESPSSINNFLQTTSKPQGGISQNFTGMILGWFPFKVMKRFLFHGSTVAQW